MESVPFVLDLLRQQADPALLDADAIAGAQAVAEYQDDRRRRARRTRCGAAPQLPAAR